MGKPQRDGVIGPRRIEDIIEEVSAYQEPPPPEPPPPEPETGLFEELDEEAAGAITTRAPLAPLDDGIPRLDSDLTPDEKQEFIRLLNQFMPVTERAKQLAKLAKFTDQKRAAVGLRAIEQINEITGLTGDRPTEAPPMFTLPADTKVNITVAKVLK